MIHIFAGQDYYPRGGWYDHHSTHNLFTVAEEAVAAIQIHALDLKAQGYSHHQWIHVVVDGVIEQMWHLEWQEATQDYRWERGDRWGGIFTPEVTP